MEFARSIFYAELPLRLDEGAILAQITAVCEENPTYGYRRVDAELRHRGLVVNAKRVRRLMAENGLNPKRRRRYLVTTDSNHDGPIFPHIARGFEVYGPDQLWVADITYVAIATGFVYLAVILVPPGRGLCPRPEDRRPPLHRGAEGRNRLSATPAGVHVPLGPRSAICVRAASRPAQAPRILRVDEQARKPLQ